MSKNQHYFKKLTHQYYACYKNEIISLDDAPVLHAVIEDDSLTKTSLDEDNNVLWSAGDQVVAFMKTSLGLKYQIKDQYVGKNSGYFSKVSSESSDDLGAGVEFDHNVVYYPYSDAAECSKSGSGYSLSVVLPAEQTYTADSFGNGSMPMVAVSEDNNITFRNVCGGMKLQLKGAQKVISIRLEGKGSEKLSGAATVTAYTDETKPAITMSSDASTSVTLDCGDGIQLNESTATEFIISVPPVVFTKGFTVTITDSDNNVQTVATDKSNEVKRSSLLVMPEITLEPVENIPADIGEFKENQYLVYTDNYKFVPSGDSYWGMRPFFKSRVSSIGEIELKFQMSSIAKAYLFYSERPFSNNGAYVNSSGLVLHYGNSGYNVINNEKIITWDEMGVSPTDRIVLRISLSEEKVIVNGKEISISGITDFTDIGYLFSSYYYHNDDGYAKEYDTVPVNSKLYYVKIWSDSGALVYHGYASLGEYSDGSYQYGWKSVYGDNIYYEYHRTNFESEWVYSYSSSWKHFDGGVDEGNDYIDEYGINHGPGVQIDDVVWAPVNCGYHATDYKYGKLYQWGRKYGQGYSGELYVDGALAGEISDVTIPILSTGGVSLTDGQHESNANVFYTSTSEFNYDWVYPQDGTLWNSGTESEPVKTEYDPCPSGWRVPTYAELNELRRNKSSWTTDSNGREGYYFSGASAYTEQVPQVFFPAAGYRFDDGDSYYRGSCGNYWSSNSHSNYARLLYVDSGNIYMSSYYSRANGYSVRCVQVTDEVAEL